MNFKTWRRKKQAKGKVPMTLLEKPIERVETCY